MKSGVIYARYSAGPNQTDQSIEGQVVDCTAYAEANGIKIIEVYADRHISGKSIAGRDEFQRMLRDAEHKRFQCVIVWKIDRFGRNREDIAISKMKLRRAGVELHYAKESVPDGPEGIILESVLEGLAEYYSEDLKQKVKRGLRESTKKGRYCGKVVPIGYKLDADRHVHVDPETAPLVREAFRMHIAGSTTKEIQEMLSRSGVVVSKGAVFNMLRNKRYIGVWEFGGVPLDVPGIIDEHIFEEAQECMKTSRNNGAGKATVNYLLSGKCYCALCGAKIVGESGKSHTGAVYHYYKCGSKKRGQKCELKAVKQELLEETVISATTEDMLTDETIAEITAKVMELQEKSEQSEYVNYLKKQLEDAEKRRRNLLRLVEKAGDMELEGVPERIAEITEEIKDLKGEIIREELSRPHLTETAVRLWLETFRDGDKKDANFRKKLASTFIDHIELGNGEALIYYNISENNASHKGSRTGHVAGLEKRYSNPIIWENHILLRIRIPA